MTMNTDTSDLSKETTFSRFEQMCLRYPDNTAVIYLGERFSYTRLKDLSERFAGALDTLGVRKGDRVMIYISNCIQWVVAFIGIQKIGAMIVSDPREFELPDVGWITLEDAESGEQVDLNTSDATVRKRYSEMASERHKRVQKALRSAGIDLLDLFTDTSYLPALLSFFSARKGRAS